MPLTSVGGSTMLAALLPGDADRYVALYEDAACTVELDVSGYARVAYTGWTTSVDGKSRSNSAPVTWAAFANGGLFAGLAIVDSAVGGEKLFELPVKNLVDEDVVAVESGDYPEMAIGSLRVEVS